MDLRLMNMKSFLGISHRHSTCTLLVHLFAMWFTMRFLRFSIRSEVLFEGICHLHLHQLICLIYSRYTYKYIYKTTPFPHSFYYHLITIDIHCIQGSEIFNRISRRHWESTKGSSRKLFGLSVLSSLSQQVSLRLARLCLIFPGLGLQSIQHLEDVVGFP